MANKDYPSYTMIGNLNNANLRVAIDCLFPCSNTHIYPRLSLIVIKTLL